MTSFPILARWAVSALAMIWSGEVLACPDYTQNGAQGTYNSDQLYTPVRHRVAAGGDIDLDDCPRIPGSGWVTRAPDFTFTLRRNASAGRRLRFRVEAGCDTVLLVNAPSGGWRFDDDSGGNLDPQIDFRTAPDGIYDIWVGTANSRPCAATLISETFNNQYD